MAWAQNLVFRLRIVDSALSFSKFLLSLVALSFCVDPDASYCIALFANPSRLHLISLDCSCGRKGYLIDI